MVFKRVDSRLALLRDPLANQRANWESLKSYWRMRCVLLPSFDRIARDWELAKRVRVSEEGYGKSRNAIRLANLSRAGAGFRR